MGVCVDGAKCGLKMYPTKSSFKKLDVIVMVCVCFTGLKVNVFWCHFKD